MQRLDVCNQLHHLIFTYLSLERRHDRSKAYDKLRLRVGDRFTNVRLINSDCLAALKLLLLPENPDFAPIEVSPRRVDSFAIEGVYVGLIRPN